MNNAGADVNRIRVPEDSGTLKGVLKFVLSELKPRGKVLTPFNVITGIIIAVGIVMIAWRLAAGLGATTNLNQEFPWGIWIGFDVVTGVAFAGGAYILCFMVHILHIKKYEPIVRAVVLNGFLSYAFYSGALLLDIGRPWKIINPIIGNGFGYGSVLFLVAWHFLLYLMCLFAEVAPAISEWLNWPRVRNILHKLTTGAVILGITLSTLHQAGLGALFLAAPAKVHPLWWSSNIPILFFVSSMFAGFSMITIESMFTHKVFADQLDPAHHHAHDEILFGLAKGSAGVMFAYLFLKMVDLIHGHRWGYLATGWGAWYLLEVVGLVAVPVAVYIHGIRNRSVRVVQWGAVLTALGVILNRLNISVIAFKWYSTNHYVPSLLEVWVTAAVISLEIWVFRFMVSRMPIIRQHPDFPEHGEHDKTASVPVWKVAE